MATDKVQGNKTPSWADRTTVSGQRLDSATYIGVIKNNVDPTRSGRLQVWIPEFGGSQNDTTETNTTFWRTVSYASPYFGSTFQPQTSVNNNFDESNQTYGMWMVPPDIGNQVLCTFVNGDPNRGFWFACISPTLSHYMVPGIAAGNNIDPGIDAAMRPSVINGINPPQSLPVSEFNENQPDVIKGNFIDNPKPIHDFQANVLFKQGLDRDSTRGAITSSSQRESPSHVFGISTPGRPAGNDPADDPEYQSKLAAGTISESDYAVRLRKGGHQFVMDDGSIMGADQLVRLRSAAGHQILMHDTKKTMYIANSEGSVWIELAESGHMHIYTAGGFNLRTEGELNLHAKNIKMQAEADFNVSAGGAFNVSASALNLTGTNSTKIYGGKVNMGAGGAMTISAGRVSVGAFGPISLNGSTIDLNSGIGGNSIGPSILQAYKHDDTTFNTTTRLWSTVKDGASSIVGIMPAHEPWNRNASTLGPAPEKQVENSICPPKSASGGNILGVMVAGGAGPLGDWIARYESGTASYNAFNRGGPAAPGTGSPRESLSLVGMNISDVQAAQNLDRTDANKFKRLFAVGRYQVITGTLASALTALKIPSSQKFDETTQDNIFNNYLCRAKRPPIARYLDNPDQNDTALLSAAVIAMAQEWASMGIPAGTTNAAGRPSAANASYYAGDGVNAAHGDVTGSTAALKAQWQYLKDLKSGATPAAGGLQTSSGAPVTDGSNNPVKTGDATSTEKKDIGIINSSGKALSGDSCPAEYLGKDTAYSPPAGIGSGKPLLNQNHAKAMHAELGYFESQWEYDRIVDPSTDTTSTTAAAEIGPRLGKYQIDAPYLADTGYVKPDAVTQYKAKTLANDTSWAGKDKINSQLSFIENKSTQDDVQFNEFNENFTALLANGGITEDDDICIAAGMLFVAHQMRSADKAKEWRDKGELTDVRGIQGEVYFNHGRYAIDVLSAGAAPAGTAGLGGENTSGIAPDDVFTFTTTGTGTRARFDSLNGEFKTQMSLLAQAYKDKTGSKIAVSSTVRTQAEQTVLYEAWTNAGGSMSNPKVIVPGIGGITTPVKTVGSHGDGIAMDAGQMNIVVSAVGAAKIAELGLKWGGTYRTPDLVHMTLANAPKPNTTPPANPVIPE